MDDQKKLNKRKKSIMVIDKKGNAREILKEVNKTNVSTLIDRTDKKKDKEYKLVEETKNVMNGKETDRNLTDGSLKKVDDKKDISEVKTVNMAKSVADKETKNNLSEHETPIIDTKDNTAITNKEEDKINSPVTDNKVNTSLTEKEDNTSVINKVSIEKDTIRNAEITAGVAAGTGITLGKSLQEEKHVQIHEDKNKEYSVKKDKDKSDYIFGSRESMGRDADSLMAFTPQRIPNESLPEKSEIKEERDRTNVDAEGHFWKRRRIFACFWHEKYFVLTKQGILKYHKANGTKYSKGHWDIKNVRRIHEVFNGSETHPYKLALLEDNDSLLFGYDDPNTREYWLKKFSKFINQ